jgi:hypothetical protein
LTEAYCDLFDFLIPLEGYKPEAFANVQIDIPPKPLRGSQTYIIPMLKPKDDGNSDARGYDVGTRYSYVFVRKIGCTGFLPEDFWQVCQIYPVARRRYDNGAFGVSY